MSTSTLSSAAKNAFFWPMIEFDPFNLIKAHPVSFLFEGYKNHILKTIKESRDSRLTNKRWKKESSPLSGRISIIHGCESYSPQSPLPVSPPHQHRYISVSGAFQVREPGILSPAWTHQRYPGSPRLWPDAMWSQWPGSLPCPWSRSLLRHWSWRTSCFRNPWRKCSRLFRGKEGVIISHLQIGCKHTVNNLPKTMFQ